jgi:hypothetical protein
MDVPSYATSAFLSSAYDSCTASTAEALLRHHFIIHPLWCVAACHNSKLARIIANKLFQGHSAVNHQLVWVGGVRVCAGSEGGEEAIDCCFQTSFFHTLHSVFGAAQPGLCLPGHDDRWNTAYIVSLPSPRTEKTQMQSPTL